jgi:hypothetical protein
MATAQPTPTVPVALRTGDGVALTGDLALAAGAAKGAALVCHPHPQFGGNRFDIVVEALFGALVAAGWHALRFDFRAEHDGGVAERLDVVAAVDHLCEIVDDVPIVATGYSFGAAVMLSTTHPRLAARVAVAPPLRHMPIGTPAEPTLVIAPAHDQFTPPDDVHATVAGWPHASVALVDGADHFLQGRTAVVGRLAVDWLARR